jgi:hypothetical protein
MDTVKLVEVFTNLVYNFGPFAFSILFLFVVSGWCNKQYKNANAKTPPASAGEIQTYRWFFICSFVIGCGLAIYSVVWWSNAQAKYFIFDAQIIGVPRQQQIRPTLPVISGGPPQQDEDDTVHYEFIVINEGPIRPAQVFTVQLLSGAAGSEGGVGAAREPLQMVYRGNAKERFQIKMADGHPTLVPIQ